MRLAVTTARSPSRALRAEARDAAARHHLPFVEREAQRLPELVRQVGVEALLVLGGRTVTLHLDGADHCYAPGMGALRARRLVVGELVTRDPFLAAAGLLPGDQVLDCTLGLGADSLVAAEAVGGAGCVVALESSPALAAWVAEGLRRVALPAARRIEVRCAEHGPALAELPDRSFDVVLFDPMFRHARAQARTFDAVRRLADHRPLEPAALERARRVARRFVVVKDGAPGWDLRRLGLAPLPGSRWAKRLYGRAAAVTAARP